MKMALIAALSATALAGGAAAAPTYVASSWSDDSVYVLDENFNPISSFMTTASDPNGVDSDGSIIFTGHPFSTQLQAYATDGTFLYSFTIPAGTQGLALFGSEVAVAASGETIFYDVVTGVETRRFGNSGSTVEGLTVHEGLLWELGDQIIARNPLTGVQLSSFANAASGCGFGGTGIASAGVDQLALSCTNGDWYRVSDTTGAVIASGNNGIDMFGLGDFIALRQEVPEPGALGLLGLGLLGLGLRRRN